jgi:hypothetical protein
MAFSDTLKDILDQGVQVSREIAEKTGKKTMEFGKATLEASADFAAKAGAKIQELGEKGVLVVEIKQLEGQVRKLIAGLGAKTYGAFEKGGPIDPADPEFSQMFAEIGALKEAIEIREEELKNR